MSNILRFMPQVEELYFKEKNLYNINELTFILENEIEKDVTFNYRYIFSANEIKTHRNYWNLFFNKNKNITNEFISHLEIQEGINIINDSWKSYKNISYEKSYNANMNIFFEKTNKHLFFIEYNNNDYPVFYNFTTNKLSVPSRVRIDVNNITYLFYFLGNEDALKIYNLFKKEMEESNKITINSDILKLFNV